ncbi:MAG: hypothetical protein IPK60_10100 [Sandaracinaceae bacterium]|nr:hypothetical protein [Sandaracinaceae bacterium]
MGDPDEHHRKVMEGLRKRADALGVPLLNNTKWREVFHAAIGPHVSVGGKLVGWDEDPEQDRDTVRMWIGLDNDEKIGESGLRDPGFGGGPCNYWEIIEAHFKSTAPTAEQRAEWIAAFEQELRSLRVAHVTTGREVVVHGYDKI